MSEEKKDDHAEGGIETYKFIAGGIMVIVLFMVIFGLKSYYKTKKSEDKNTTNTEQGTKEGNKNPTSNFAISGHGTATMENPIEAYLDPRITHTSLGKSQNGKYVLKSDPTIVFICNGHPDSMDFGAFPAGDYLIYPEGSSSIEFSWWQ